ncbi:MAG TPA: MBL fold metallo-hydrolase, partial [Jatrophihabitans sp.]|nr:MBL fold metallo-hydrolase [Jatrophihabitans sp.]
PAATVLTTHRHPDHWQALASVVAETGARTLAGEHDADGIPVPTDQLLKHGDRVQVGELELAAIELRGHTPGSIALYYADPDGAGHLFTGDSLFPGGVGRTTKPADFQQLIGDVSSRLFDAYDDDTWFYPGHGADSTLGAERPHLDEWRERGW